jgi:hypothetical protein
MHIVVLEELDTALLTKMRNIELRAALDSSKEVIVVKKKGYVELRWKKQGPRKLKGGLLNILRYWVTPWGTRKIRLQCHKVHSDGYIGSRNIIEERHNGKKVR